MLPKIDLMFVLSSQSSKSFKTFPYMKDVVTYIMQNYSTNQIHYAVVLYGNEPSVVLKFSDGITDPDRLVELVSSASNIPGGSALDKALQKAKQLFTDDDAVRPDARQILVVMTDDESSGDREVAKGVAQDLIDNHVTIITVAVGSEVDSSEMESLSPTDGFSMNTTSDEDPEKTGEEIIRLIAEGTFLCKEFPEISIWLGTNSSKSGDVISSQGNLTFFEKSQRKLKVFYRANLIPLTAGRSI